MLYNLSRIQKEFIEICNQAGVNVNTPITLNGRLSRTLGRVKAIQYGKNGQVIPVKVEFSSTFIKKGVDEDIRQVILHEAAHYIVIKRTGEDHKHDKVFKAVCAEIGTWNDGTQIVLSNQEELEKTRYKYDIYCPDCDQIVDSRSRWSKTLQYINCCSCPLCLTKGKLMINQNW